jgi:hypothetical protein
VYCAVRFCSEYSVFQSAFAGAKSRVTARRSVNCGYDQFYDCSCLLGALRFRALLTGERFAHAGTRLAFSG